MLLVHSGNSGYLLVRLPELELWCTSYSLHSLDKVLSLPRVPYQLYEDNNSVCLRRLS